MVFANNNSEAMRILSTGSVGIGEQSPTELLQVNGSIRSLQTTNTGISQLITDASNTVTYRGALATFGNTATDTLLGIGRASNSFLYKNGGTLVIGTEGNYPLIFSTFDAEAARVSPARNLLIGTTTDAGQKLQVAGSAKITGITSIGNVAANNALSDNTILRTTSGSTNSGASIGNCFIAAGSGSGFDTGISVNMGTCGGTMLLMASINTSTGTSTNSAVYIVRFYFDGNNAPSTSYLGGSSDFVTFSVSGSNTLILTASNSGNRSYSWFINKLEN
jgi:hypothetical protein